MEPVFAIETFLHPFLPLRKPLLVGFSGGEDSTALVKAFEELGIPYEIAHFDHGWREGSQREAEKFRLSAKAPFHTKRSVSPAKNELLAREERYHFFQTLFSSGKFQALVLAHHQHDQAETVLKRVLEGSHLSNLKGILPVSKRGEMPIWRPLLSTSKEAIRAYIADQEVLDDPTNRDPQYLRARMREKILPALSADFGKEVISSLARLAKYGAELEDFLKQRQILACEGPFGKRWDFSHAHPIEIRYSLQRAFGTSQPVLDQIIGALLSGKANFHVGFSSIKLIVDRGFVYQLHSPLPSFDYTLPLKVGNISIGDWNFDFTVGEYSPPDWWQGKFSLTIPQGAYQLAPPVHAFRKEWNTKKIPAFLRGSLPILLENGEPIAHFFALHSASKNFSNMMSINIEIKQKVCYTDVKG